MQQLCFVDPFPELSGLPKPVKTLTPAMDVAGQPQIHSRLVKMYRVNRPSHRKLIALPVTQESIETQLALWVRELVQRNSKLVPALERLRCSYSLLQTGKPVTDAEDVLWQVERALKHVEISSLIGLAWLRGRKRHYRRQTCRRCCSTSRGFRSTPRRRLLRRARVAFAPCHRYRSFHRYRRRMTLSGLAWRLVRRRSGSHR
jgi:hypothetical protein